jgi:RHS repeat-associated protein
MMQLSGRHSEILNAYQLSSGYRYSFNGMESDKEVKGEKNSYTTEFRQYDPRVGRWLSIDPLTKAHESVYVAFANSPLFITDIGGADTSFADDNTRKFVMKFVTPELKKNGELKKKQKYYDPEYAKKFQQLVESEDMFNFTMRTDGNQRLAGSVSYDGVQINIVFGEGESQGGWSVAGVLFEETFHATQILDGKTYFVNVGENKWLSVVDIYDEVEAKRFALTAPGNNMYCSSNGISAIRTQAGMISQESDQQAAYNLSHSYTESGTKRVTIDGITTYSKVQVTITAAYLLLLQTPQDNDDALINDKKVFHGEKIDSDLIFGYPTKK